ncbi:MAG: hypothetical protein SchgKO_07620 [Schleiferiaceae bacterium]
MFLLFVLLFAGLSSGFAFYMVERMYGLTAEEFMQFSNPETPLSHSQALKLFQLISALGTFVIPSIVFTQLLHPVPEEYLHLNKLPKILGWVLSIGLLFAFIPIVDLLGYVNETWSALGFLQDMADQEAANAQVNLITQMDGWGSFLYTFLIIVIIPAIGEEFLFRGVLQKLLISTTQRMHLSIFITGLLFGLLHGQPSHLLALMALGILFGYLKEWTGSLWVPILLHLINNGTLLIEIFFFDFQPEAYSGEVTTPDYTLVGISVVASAALIWLFIKRPQLIVNNPNSKGVK